MAGARERWLEQRRRRDGPRRAEVMTLPVVRVRQHATLDAQRAGEVLVRVSIGPEGEAVALWTPVEDLSALTTVWTSPAGVRGPDARTPRPVAARVSVHRAGTVNSVGITELTLAHSTVQMLPDGGVLVVAARCGWRPEGPDRNAVVVDADGHVTAEATLGDGIAAVRVSRSGDVWVEYFDEGVYGNYGWGGGLQGPTPIGATGLVRFSPDLRARWRYPRTAMAFWGPIDECYVLNLDHDAVWTCYDAGHPAVRVADGVVTGWRNPTDRGGQALLVGGERVAVCGGGHGPTMTSCSSPDVGRMNWNC